MISNETRRRMVELIASGELSSYQIAARVHVTPSTVRKATRQLKQQQAGTHKPRGRSFYAVPLIDLVPKTTKLDDAKSATVKANRLELIKAAMQKRTAPPPALADIPVIEASGIMCGDEGATADLDLANSSVSAFIRGQISAHRIDFLQPRICAITH